MGKLSIWNFGVLQLSLTPATSIGEHGARLLIIYRSGDGGVCCD